MCVYVCGYVREIMRVVAYVCVVFYVWLATQAMEVRIHVIRTMSLRACVCVYVSVLMCVQVRACVYVRVRM